MRIAVVGARGKMGRHYVRLLEQDHNVVEVEIGDSIEAAARASDAGIIASPTNLHLAHASEFIRNGVPVLIEKPIALDVDEARLLVDLADFQGTPVAVGYLERFNPAVIEAGADLLKCQAFTMVRWGPTPVSHVYGPVSIDLASHELDLLNLLFGPIKFSVEPIRTDWDTCSYMIEVPGGPLGHVMAARTRTTSVRKWLIDGAQHIVVDLAEQTITRDGVDVPLIGINKLERQLAAFFDLIRGETSRIATAEDGLKVLALLDARAVQRAAKAYLHGKAL